MSTPKTLGAAAKRLQSAKGAALASSFTNQTSSSSTLPGLLDVFPVWNDQQATDKEDKNAGN
jgi:hypothetical protein